jgi:hypothetical protein
MHTLMKKMCLPVTNTLKWTVSTYTHTSVLYTHEHHGTSENMPFIFTALIYSLFVKIINAYVIIIFKWLPSPP